MPAICVRCATIIRSFAMCSIANCKPTWAACWKFTRPRPGCILSAGSRPGKMICAASLAAQAGIQLLPISTFSLEPLARGGLVFGYAGTDEEAIPHEVKRLRAALEHL